MMKQKFIGIIFLSSCAFAQSPLMPDGRESAVFVYDSKTKSMMLFDGYQIHLDSTRSDVWRWNGKNWKQSVAFGPSSRSLSAIALDEKRNEVFLFAGVGKGNYEDKKSDLWKFSNNAWSLVARNPIGSRDHHELVYADNIDALLLYGGLDGNRVADSTTWIIKNGKFNPMNIPGPGTRYHFAMAYDKSRRVVVLYGGGRNNQRDELWEFDGTHWINIKNANAPGKKMRHSMTYDENQKAVIMHGGDASGITWSWNGKTWMKIAEGGPKADLIALGFDTNRNVVVAYGGGGEDNQLLSELWELKASRWQKVSENGKWKWAEDKFVPVK